VQYFGENESVFPFEVDHDEYEVDVNTTLEPDTAPDDYLSSQALMQRTSVLADGIPSGPRLKRTPSSSSADFSARPGAMQRLIERGQEHSSLVSLGLSSSLQTHWAVKASRRNVSFFGNLARSLAATDSLLSSILRIAALISVSIALIVCTISVASIAQQYFNLFPQLISYHKLSSGVLHFDHRVANITLFPSPDMLLNQSGLNLLDAHKSWDVKAKNLSEPYYAACDWSWEGFSLLDFAILSEAAYFDEDGSGSLKAMIDDLFPNEGLTIVRSHERKSAGPLFLEIASSESTIISIRGTDVGRLRDFMENAKLFGEPVVFQMLSSIFPTMRYWSHNTGAKVIAWLFELNSFFGLQEEADYYKPLVERVMELSRQGTRVIITGHSLGGGLARIVGALTHEPSVSFSPPGLAMSHRKYSVKHSDGSITRIQNKGLHGRSIAVVTDYDFLAQIDHQVGLVQRILCDKDDKAHQNSCHLLEGTICHILEHCGDRRHRFASCEHTYDLAAVLPVILSMAQGNLALLVTIVLLGPITIALAVIPEIV
jgi:hypothetical protein